MSHLGDLGLGAVGDLLGTGISTAANSYLLKKQFEYNKEMYQNRYQWTVQDLRKAGLNPVLAAGGLSGGAASVGLVGANSGSVNSAATQYRRMNAIEKKQLDIAQQNADSTASGVASENALREKQGLTQDAQKGYYSALEAEALQNIVNSKVSTAAQAMYYKDLGEAAKANAASQYIQAVASQTSANAAWQNSQSQKGYYTALGQESASRKAKYDWELEFEKGNKGWRSKPAFGGQGEGAVTYGELIDSLDATINALSPFKF